MIYMTGNMNGESRRAVYEQYPDLGMLYSPEGWQNPWCQHYAVDNDVFAHSVIGTRPDPSWWHREGESKWLKMLEKLPRDTPPMFVLLPDVVGDWDATLEQSEYYRPVVDAMGFRCALALQDGCRTQDVLAFRPDAVFVGGTTAWKWQTAPKVPPTYKPHGIHTHLGRCNGEDRIRRAKRMGFDSADGTGLCRFWDAILPVVLRGLYEDSPQMEMQWGELTREEQTEEAARRG